MESTSATTDSVEIRPRCYMYIINVSVTLASCSCIHVYKQFKSHSRIAPSFHCLEYGKAGEGLHGNFSHDVINN